MSATARLLRDRPYQAEHERSVERTMDKGRPPAGTGRMVAWLLTAWSDEIPGEIHKAGVWRDYGLHADGGSVMGSPQDADAFRRMIYGPPWATDYDRRIDADERGAVYLFPLRLALSRMGRSGDEETRDAAHAAYAIASSGGDWRHVLGTGCWTRPRQPQFRLTGYTAYSVLRRVWDEFETRPRERAA